MATAATALAERPRFVAAVLGPDPAPPRDEAPGGRTTEALLRERGVDGHERDLARQVGGAERADAALAAARRRGRRRRRVVAVAQRDRALRRHAGEPHALGRGGEARGGD